MLPARLSTRWLGPLASCLRPSTAVCSIGAGHRRSHPATSVVSKAAPSRFYSSADVGPDGLPRTVDLRIGDRVPHVFSDAEFQKRLQKLRTHMAAEGLGAAVMTSYHNVNYYGGLLYCAFGRHYAVVIKPDSCTFVSPSVDGAISWRRTPGADNHVSYTDWHKGNFFHVIKNLIAGVNGRVGLEFDHVTLETKQKFDSVIPNDKVDIGTDAMRLRIFKSNEEIALIKKSARIADIGGAAFVDAVKEGAQEYEVAMASTQTLIRELARAFPNAEYGDTWSNCQSGPHSDSAHHLPTTRRLQKGDIISLNCFPIIAGYYTALERTLFLDHASDAHLRVWEANCEVHRRGLELVQPGVRCSDVANALNEIFRKHDLLKYRTFGYGHSFGVISHYYGREAALELREDVHTVLEPGMVVSMEPMVVIPEGQPGAGGYREHDILVVHENGSENITDFPLGPEHNIIKA